MTRRADTRSQARPTAVPPTPISPVNGESSSKAPITNGNDEHATICVVEAFTAIRQLTVQFLEGLGGLRVVGTAGSFEEALQVCTQTKPKVAIIDGFMWSQTQGVSLARAIQSVSPTTKILIFCPSSNPEAMREAIDANVAGFVLRSDPAETFAKAVRAVLRGETYFCSEIALLLRHPDRGHLSGPGSAALSPRERKVLQEIARGRLSKEIADALGMSVFGVQNVRRRISRKTGLTTVAQLTLHAAKLRLVAAPDQR